MPWAPSRALVLMINPRQQGLGDQDTQLTLAEGPEISTQNMGDHKYGIHQTMGVLEDLNLPLTPMPFACSDPHQRRWKENRLDSTNE